MDGSFARFVCVSAALHAGLLAAWAPPAASPALSVRPDAMSLEIVWETVALPAPAVSAPAAPPPPARAADPLAEEASTRSAAVERLRTIAAAAAETLAAALRESAARAPRRTPPAPPERGETSPAGAPPLPGAPESPPAPRATNLPPRYPERGRLKGIEGRMVARVTVSPEGRVEAIEVVSSTGHAILDEAAIAAIRDWTFAPATRGGVPVRGTVDIPILFVLHD